MAAAPDRACGAILTLARFLFAKCRLKIKIEWTFYTCSRNQDMVWWMKSTR